MQAMQRRGMGDVGASQQMSPAAAGEQVVSPSVDPMAQGGMAAPQEPPAAPDTELMTAIKALGSFITSESKAKREAAQFQGGGMQNGQSY